MVGAAPIKSPSESHYTRYSLKLTGKLGLKSPTPNGTTNPWAMATVSESSVSF
jgi:hypothetical protein